MKRRSLKRFLSWGMIGPLMVAGAIWWAGPKRVLAVLAGGDPVLIAAAAAMALPLVAIRGWRWKLLLRGFGVDITLRESTAMYAMGMTLAAVTPGRAGDFVKVLALRGRGCGVALAAACSVFDRLLDVGFVLLAGYAGMWYFSRHFASQLRAVNVVAAGVLAALLIIAASRRTVARVGMRLMPARYRPAARESWNRMVGGFVGMGAGRMAQLTGWTVACWLIQFLAVWLCGRALGLELPFVYLSACAVMVSLSSFLPVTVAGAGTRDAIFVVLLGQLGVTGQQSLALSSLVLAVFLSNCGVFYAVSAVLAGRGGTHLVGQASRLTTW